MARLPKRVTRRLFSIFFSLLIIGIIWIAQEAGWLKKATDTARSTQPGLYHVLTFEDGDTLTIDMNGKAERIRFIGVDTPETQDPRYAVQCFGKVAAAFTKELIGNNDIRLKADPSNTNRDRYGRLLRYVYLPDGRFVNAEIIKQGYGFAYTLFPFEKMAEFREYERQAREQNLGLWSTCEIQDQEGKKTTNPA